MYTSVVLLTVTTLSKTCIHFEAFYKRAKREKTNTHIYLWHSLGSNKMKKHNYNIFIVG